MEIRANEIKLVDIKNLKPNPENNNKHSQEQLEQLEKIIAHQGFRSPIIVSNRSGFIVCGHARFEVAKEMGFKKLPVIYQDFDNADDEYAHLTADNAIAAQADLDFSMINAKLQDLGPDFDLDLLGIKDFQLDKIPEVKNTGAELNLDSFDNFDHQCPKCGFEWNDDGSDNS